MDADLEIKELQDKLTAICSSRKWSSGDTELILKAFKKTRRSDVKELIDNLGYSFVKERIHDVELAQLLFLELRKGFSPKKLTVHVNQKDKQPGSVATLLSAHDNSKRFHFLENSEDNSDKSVCLYVFNTPSKSWQERVDKEHLQKLQQVLFVPVSTIGFIAVDKAQGAFPLSLVNGKLQDSNENNAAIAALFENL